MDPKIPHFRLTMRMSFGVPLPPTPTRPEDLEEGVMEAAVRSEAVSDCKYRVVHLVEDKLLLTLKKEFSLLLNVFTVEELLI